MVEPIQNDCGPEGFTTFAAATNPGASGLPCAPSAAPAGPSEHFATRPARARIALISLRVRASSEAGERSAKLHPCSIFRVFEPTKIAVRGY